MRRLVEPDDSDVEMNDSFPAQQFEVAESETRVLFVSNWDFFN